ncbi:MAG: hypothetical protein ING19_00755 [Azospirillum sp.]|nr:hypothetical protein [Azospirillum sp.]
MNRLDSKPVQDSDPARDMIEAVLSAHPQTSDGRKGPWSHTFTGKGFFLLDPKPEDYDLLDAAHSLSHAPRWIGHAIHQQRTAAHSIGLSHIIEETTGDLMAAYHAHHHDDSEYAFPDIPSPIKRSTPFFSAIERPIEIAFARALGIPLEYIDHPLVKEFDKSLASDEYAEAMSFPPPYSRTSRFGRIGAGVFDPGEARLPSRMLEIKFIERHFDLAIRLDLASESDLRAAFERLASIYENHRKVPKKRKDDEFHFSKFCDDPANKATVARASEAARRFLMQSPGLAARRHFDPDIHAISLPPSYCHQLPQENVENEQIDAATVAPMRLR